MRMSGLGRNNPKKIEDTQNDAKLTMRSKDPRLGLGHSQARKTFTPFTLSRKNNRFGLALAAIFVALFVGACIIALVYLQVD